MRFDVEGMGCSITCIQAWERLHALPAKLEPIPKAAKDASTRFGAIGAVSGPYSNTHIATGSANARSATTIRSGDKC